MNADQIPNFTLPELHWASLHDWFISGDQFEIRARNEWVKDGKVTSEVVTHTNFRTMRDWAGY